MGTLTYSIILINKITLTLLWFPCTSNNKLLIKINSLHAPYLLILPIGTNSTMKEATYQKIDWVHVFANALTKGKY